MNNAAANEKIAERTHIGTSPAGVEWYAYPDRHTQADVDKMERVLAEKWERHNRKQIKRVRNLTDAQMYHVEDHLLLCAEADGLDADEWARGKTYLEAPAQLLEAVADRLEDDAEFAGEMGIDLRRCNDNPGAVKFAQRQKAKSLRAAARKIRAAIK